MPKYSKNGQKMDDKKTKYESLEEVPDSIKEKLKKYFTNLGGNTFAMINFPSELTGGALARYSRAPLSMQLTIINEFLDESGEPSQTKGSELMDRVLNAYGDDSVGELEGTHIGMENVSQLLTKTIEDKRIGGSPIEQSTRYVRYDQKDKDGKWRYLRPEEIKGTAIEELYEKVNDSAFSLYSELIQKLSEYFKKKLHEENFQIEVTRDSQKVKVNKNQLINEAEQKAFRNAYNFTIRCAALDVGRCVLPASTLTQLGIFGNGRFFTNLITALKSGPLQEEKIRGLELESELKKVIPTFIKRNKEDSELTKRYVRIRKIANQYLRNIPPESNSVTLIKKSDYLDELVSSILFSHTNLSLKQILEEVKKIPQQEKLEIFNEYIGQRTQRRDRTGRALEAGYPIVFDLVGGFAEYRDLQRHRMLTQQRQMLTVDLGFIMPPEVIELGLQDRVESLVSSMAELNRNMKELGLQAASQYATLFNHRMRFMLGMNLREFQHLSELRTQPAGHFSYRAMVMEMSKQLKIEHPWTEKAYQFVDYSDPDNKISRAKEQSRIAGKNLSSGISGDIDFV
jgi:thymidylate synthase ThyX